MRALEALVNDPRRFPPGPERRPALPQDRDGVRPEQPRVQVLCGWHAVEAALQSRPQACRKLLHSEARLGDLKPYLRHLAERRAAYRVAGEAELAKVAGTPAHQGVVAAFDKPQVRRLDQAALRRCAGRAGLVLALDGVSNPHNLGALARTAAFFGVQTLLVGPASVPALLSTAAYRVAEGGLDRLEVLQVEDLPAAAGQFLRAGGQTAALDVRGACDLREWRGAAAKLPTLLVIGAEEDGVSEAAVLACGQALRIGAGAASGGRMESLNVSVATGIAIAELLAAATT